MLSGEFAAHAVETWPKVDDPKAPIPSLLQVLAPEASVEDLAHFDTVVFGPSAEGIDSRGRVKGETMTREIPKHLRFKCESGHLVARTSAWANDEETTIGKEDVRLSLYRAIDGSLVGELRGRATGLAYLIIPYSTGIGAWLRFPQVTHDR
jgi:hypothetical protein